MLKEYKLRDYNFRLIVYIILLNIIGILVIRSATNSDPSIISKQLLGIAVGFVLMIAISLIPYNLILKMSGVIYSISIFLLLLVIFMGREVGGAKRWVRLPLIGQIQPSEFVKIGIIIVVSWYIGKFYDSINDIKTLVILAGIIAVPILLIMKQPDLSTTIVIVITILSMIFVSGISYRWVGSAIAVVTPITLVFIYLLQYELIPFIRGYQAKRILAFVNRAKYADANLQQDNSIMAIGSGEAFGKGLFNNTLASVKNGNFLSEEQTDFIFAVIGEELGFVGCLIVILLFALIVYECLYIAGKAKDMDGMALATGVAALIAFQSFTNIAVATGLFPNTGIPLPFISYGVSSLLSMYIAIGLVLNVAVNKTNMRF